MNILEYFKGHFDELQQKEKNSGLHAVREAAFDAFNRQGLPSAKHEEWKYTRIANLFNKEFEFPVNKEAALLSAEDLASVRLPGHEAANELVFVNGLYVPGLSTVRSSELTVQPLGEAAAGEHAGIVVENLGQSGKYLNDGINSLNTAFAEGGVFIYVKKGRISEHPVYIYNITDARELNIFCQPRSLVYVSENAQVQLVETYVTLGVSESFINQVMEVVVEKNAIMEYYKIQRDLPQANQVSTTHIRQRGKSYVHTVTISLDGGVVRNNLNVTMEAAESEAHLYGLFFLHGDSHVDNHTLVDNVAPGCLSKELYKGILDGRATGVFNGKIFVEPQAQKTNAYQSNKNILLSDTCTVNTKPQLEIFADDVKCSHGSTVGRLDEEGLFYLRARGISEAAARALLVHAYAIDVLEHIRPEPIRKYVDELISQRLEFEPA